MAGNDALYELEYYSVGGGFIEWKGYQPPKKGRPRYRYSTMKELLAQAEQHQLSIAQAAMANEVAISGKSEAEVNAFIDKIHTAMVNIVKAGLEAPPGTLPGPIPLKTKAGEVFARAKEDPFEARRAMGLVSAYALAGSEENARGHLVVTAPTSGSAGVLPALAYSVGEGGRNLPQQKIRDGLLAARVNRCLRKHNATLSGAEGGCQAEIGVASAMGAAFISQAYRFCPSGRGERGRSGAAAPPGHDLRSGRGVCAAAVHRTMRVRRHQGLCGVRDRDQRDPGAPACRIRHDRGRHGSHRQGDERQVQGNVRRWSGGVRDPLLVRPTVAQSRCARPHAPPSARALVFRITHTRADLSSVAGFASKRRTDAPGCRKYMAATGSYGDHERQLSADQCRCQRRFA